MKYSIEELANSKSVSAPVREALLSMSARILNLESQIAASAPVAHPPAAARVLSDADLDRIDATIKPGIYAHRDYARAILAAGSKS